MIGKSLSHCRILCLLYALLIAFSAPLSARVEKVEQLEPRGYVNDFAGVLDAQAEAQLTALCKEVDQKTRAQIAVVTIRSLEGASLEEFSHRLATRWGVGYKGDNRGVLILLAVSERRFRIEVGYGLEPILPDGKVGGFGREMVPLLRQGDYGGALLHVTGRIAEVIAADRGVTLTGRAPRQAPPRAVPTPAEPGESVPGYVWLLVLLGLLGLVEWYRRRTGRWWDWGDLWDALWEGGGGGDWGGFGGGDWGGFGGGDFGGGGASGSW